MRSRPVSSLLVGLMVFALVAAACGGDRASDAADPDPVTDEGSDGSASVETAETTESAADGTATETAVDGTATETAVDGTATETAVDGTATAGEEVAMFGDAPWPCGPGDAAGATDQGVTDEAIVIGAGDDRGFASAPGLNEQMTAAARVFVDKCNELGGINGRQIELIEYDAKIFEVSTAMLDACENAFMLVGEGFAVDGFGEETRVQCELAHIPAWTVSAAAAHGPNMVQPLPNPADMLPTGIARYVADTYPDEITSAASMFGNFGATIESKDKVLAAYPELGYEFSLDLEYNVNGEDDWTPFILQLKDAGAKFVYFSGSCLPNYQQVRSAALVNEFEAIWQTDANFYDSACAAANADGVMDGTLLRLGIVPFEERDSNPATDQYLTMMDEAGEGTSAVATQTVSAFLMWATAATQCGSELTRQCVIDNATAIDEWTGHGLHVPTDPGANVSPDCVVIMELRGTGYTRLFPTEPGEFYCDPANVTAIETEWSTAALLDENRVSQQFAG